MLVPPYGGVVGSHPDIAGETQRGRGNPARARKTASDVPRCDRIVASGEMHRARHDAPCRFPCGSDGGASTTAGGGLVRSSEDTRRDSGDAKSEDRSRLPRRGETRGGGGEIQSRTVRRTRDTPSLPKRARGHCRQRQVAVAALDGNGNCIAGRNAALLRVRMSSTRSKRIAQQN